MNILQVRIPDRGMAIPETPRFLDQGLLPAPNPLNLNMNLNMNPNLDPNLNLHPGDG